MDQRTRISAQAILTPLLVGRSICGVHFYANQATLILGAYDGNNTVDFMGPDEAYLMIEAGWYVPDELTLALTRTVGGPAAERLPELVALACSLRKHPIISAQIGESVPHLGLTFADGRTLLVNGWDPQYEVWSITPGEWSVWALANGDITWASTHPALRDAV